MFLFLHQTVASLPIRNPQTALCLIQSLNCTTNTQVTCALWLQCNDAPATALHDLTVLHKVDYTYQELGGSETLTGAGDVVLRELFLQLLKS